MTSQRRSPPSPKSPGNRFIRFRRPAARSPGRARPVGVLLFLQELLDDLPVDVVVYDEQGRFLYANPSAVPDLELRRWMIGRDEREFGARRGHDPELIARRLALAEEARRSLKPIRFEESRLAPSGGLRHSVKTFLPIADGDGRLRHIIGYAIDITAVRESEVRYRRLFDQSRDLVSISDLAGRVIDVNPAGLALLGYQDRDELFRLDLGRDVYVDTEERAEIFREVLRRGYFSFETRLRRKDGKILLVQGSVTTMRDDEGRPVGYLAILRDISAQRQTEEQLRQSQKMEAIGRLAGGIAHDFNNLLTAINGYCDLLLEGLRSEPWRSYAREIGAAGSRAAELTAKLLALSRQQILVKKAVVLADLVAGLEGLLRRLIGEDIVLDTQLAAEAGQVLVDPGQLEQAVLNLAINARDAMPRGGRLTLSTWRCAATTPREPLATNQDLACLEVRDTGHGIEPEHLEHLFEPFFTTKEAGKGTGLGLAMVYATARQAGGTIEVESSPGQGACFRLYFPRLEDSVATCEAPPPLTQPSLPRGHEKVLLVEDEPLVREIVREQLRRQGYEVLAASGGNEALSLIEKQLPRFDLLVSDVVMPGMSGPELAELLLARFPDLRVLFVSGYADTFTLAHGLRVAEQEILQKPFTARLLAERVRAVLDRPPA